MNIDTHKSANKRAKPINPQALAALCQGLEQLVKGQIGFAESFGLNANRVFPASEEIGQASEFTQDLQKWLRNGKANIEQIQQLFDDLMQHQLALLAALDGVALKALQVNSSNHWLQKRLMARSPVAELINDPNQRFQQLITPGFIQAYVHARESKS